MKIDIINGKKMDQFPNHLVSLLRKFVLSTDVCGFIDRAVTQGYGIQFTLMNRSNCSIVQQVADFPLRRAAKRAIEIFVIYCIYFFHFFQWIFCEEFLTLFFIERACSKQTQKNRSNIKWASSYWRTVECWRTVERCWCFGQDRFIISTFAIRH